jgi:hypothetical protein
MRTTGARHNLEPPVDGWTFEKAAERTTAGNDALSKKSMMDAGERRDNDDAEQCV